MAGNGGAPKDPRNRARTNKDVAPVRYIQTAGISPQPDLPEFDVQVKSDGEIFSQAFVWPVRTREWWAMLAHHPLRNEFFDTDWEYLLATAFVHAGFWSGDLKLAGELRLREEKYGFTPADRAKLRIFVAAAVEGEQKAIGAVEKTISARDRMQGIRKAGA